MKNTCSERLNFEAALEYLGVSKSYLYKKTYSRSIKHYKPSGKLIYFRKEDLDAFMLQNPVPTMEELDKEATNYMSNYKNVA